MTRQTGWFSVLVVALVLAVNSPATANPRPPSEIPELETALRTAVAHAGRNDCGALPRLLAQTGFSILREGTLPWIRQNMKALERCLIESQRNARTPDTLLHHEFRAHASPAGIRAMCAVLRERMVPGEERVPHREPGRAPRAPSDIEVYNQVRAYLEFADQLVMYRDPAAIPVIRTLRDSLAALPKSLVRPVGLMHDPLLLLHEDLRRLEDPDTPELVEWRDGLAWRLTRNTAEIVAVYRLLGSSRQWVDEAGRRRIEVLSDTSFGSGSPWLRIHPKRGDLERVFTLLERCTSAPVPPSTGSYRCVYLQVRFDGGLAVDLSADESGAIHWHDNTRYRPQQRSAWNPAAARAIIELADTAVLGLVDGDGVALERRREGGRPR